MWPWFWPGEAFHPISHPTPNPWEIYYRIQPSSNSIPSQRDPLNKRSQAPETHLASRLPCLKVYLFKPDIFAKASTALLSLPIESTQNTLLVFSVSLLTHVGQSLSEIFFTFSIFYAPWSHSMSPLQGQREGRRQTEREREGERRKEPKTKMRKKTDKSRRENALPTGWQNKLFLGVGNNEPAVVSFLSPPQKAETGHHFIWFFFPLARGLQVFRTFFNNHAFLITWDNTTYSFDRRGKLRNGEVKSLAQCHRKGSCEVRIRPRVLDASPLLYPQSQHQQSRLVISPPSVSKAEWQRVLSVILSVNDSTGSPFSGQAVRLAAEQEARRQVCTEHFQSILAISPLLWPESTGPRGGVLRLPEDTRRFKVRLTHQFLSISEHNKRLQRSPLQNWGSYVVLNTIFIIHLRRICYNSYELYK